MGSKITVGWWCALVLGTAGAGKSVIESLAIDSRCADHGNGVETWCVQKHNKCIHDMKHTHMKHISKKVLAM